MIAEPAKEELADDRAGKGNGRDVGSRRGVCVFGRVELTQHRADRSNDSVDDPCQSERCKEDGMSIPIKVSVREQTGAARNRGPAALPATFWESL